METLLQLFPNWHWIHLLLIPGLLIGFTVHELAHAIIAYALGDYSQVKSGRITSNFIKHISWLGLILFLIFGIGWPKPLHFDASNFKHRYLDSFLVSLSGSAANFAISIGLFLLSVILLGTLTLLQVLSPEEFTNIIFFNRNTPVAQLGFSNAMQEASVWVIALTNRIWVVNFIFAIVSLIPLPPFDGFTAVLSLMGMMRERRIKALDINVDEKEEVDSKPATLPQETGLTKKQSIANIHFQMGLEYHNEQKFDDAIARYRQALDSDASFGPAYVNLGLAYKAKNQRNEAIHALRGATLYANDEESRSQAWAELHDLSQLPDMPETNGPLLDPVDPVNTIESAEPVENRPWTDTHPRPDWLILIIGLSMFIIMFSCMLTIFLITLSRSGI